MTFEPSTGRVGVAAPERWTSHIRCKEIIKILHLMILIVCSLEIQRWTRAHPIAADNRRTFLGQQCLLRLRFLSRLNRLSGPPFDRMPATRDSHPAQTAIVNKDVRTAH